MVAAEGILIAFRLSEYNKNRASDLVKRLYGQETSSHGGKYRYRRKGLLDGTPHRRLIRGVLVLREEDERKVVRLLKDVGAETHVRRVELTAEDRRALNL